MPWTTPAAAPAGDALTATFWDAQVKGNLDVIGGAWTSYSPTLGGFTLGNGTVVAAYAQAGKWVRYRIKFTFGTTSVSSAGMTLTLPTTVHADWASAERWVARDVSASLSFFGDCDIFGGSGGFNLRVTTPFTWAAGDYLGVSGEYEAA